MNHRARIIWFLDGERVFSIKIAQRQERVNFNLEFLNLIKIANLLLL